jgi:YfiH family protein
VDSTRLSRLRQVHGTAVVSRRRGDGPVNERPLPEADIVMTDEPALALAVQTADCVPMLIADPRAGAVAAVHAGWRGLTARAPAAAVERLASDFGSRAQDLVVAVGPAIGWCCYEVGADVREQFERAAFTPKELDRWFSRDPVTSDANPPMAALPATRREGHWFFDAARSARDQLVSAGLPTAQIFVSGLCTASHSDVFCSYRRDGSPAGRLAAAIRVRSR